MIPRSTSLALVFLITATSACNQTSPPPLFLNHVSYTLDQETFRAVGDSNFLLREFSAIHRDSPPSAPARLVFFGRQTYLELMAAGQSDRSSSSTLALAIESVGDLNVARPHMLEGYPDLRLSQSLPATIPGTFLFFSQLSVDSPDDLPVEISVIEYQRPAEEGPQPPDAVTRFRNLKPLYRSDLLLNEIVEVTAALPAGESERLSNTLHRLGYQIERLHLQTLCHGPDLLVRLVPPVKATGIVAVTMRLNRPVEERQQLFGKATLRLEGDRATWIF